MDERDTSREALIFAMPFIQMAGPLRLEKATAFAMMCWNLALLPEGKRQAEVDELMSMFDFAASWFPEQKEGTEELRAWIHKLIKRKLEKFADKRRVIVQYQVSTDGHKVTLTTGTAAVDGETWRLN